MTTRPEDTEDEERDEDALDFDVESDEGVEVDISDEDPEPADEPEAAEDDEPPVEDKPRPKFRADKRITELARKNADSEQRVADLQRQLQERDEQLNTERTSNVRSMEAGLASELQAAKRKLTDAHTLGDYTAIADSTEEVSRLASDLSAVKAYALQQPRREERQPPPRQQEQARVEPRTQAWIQSNTWFSPSSPDYEQEIAIDAQAYAAKLEFRLKRDGRESEKGGDEYFRQIDEYLAKAYPDVFEYDEPAPKRKMPAMRGEQNVAPVSRQSETGRAAEKGGKMRLSAAERQQAEHFFPSLTPEQAYVKYAKGK